MSEPLTREGLADLIRTAQAPDSVGRPGDPNVTARIVLAAIEAECERFSSTIEPHEHARDAKELSLLRFRDHLRRIREGTP